MYYSYYIDLSLDGVEIIVNGSGSYYEFRKGYVRVDLIKLVIMKVCYWVLVLLINILVFC